MDRAKLKERLKELTPEEREKFEQYVASLKEIKKELKELLNKKPTTEAGGNRSYGLHMNE